jgi:hypothetical protein
MSLSIHQLLLVTFPFSSTDSTNIKLPNSVMYDDAGIAKLYKNINSNIKRILRLQKVISEFHFHNPQLLLSC